MNASSDENDEDKDPGTNLVRGPAMERMSKAGAAGVEARVAVAVTEINLISRETRGRLAISSRREYSGLFIHIIVVWFGCLIVSLV